MRFKPRLALWLFSLVFLCISACGTTEAPLARAVLASGCFIDSDCANPLICAFKKCHVQCKETRDCPSGQRCVASGRPQYVCQLPEEASCSRNAQCPGTQVCALDNQCRDGCQADRDCLTDQQCLAGSCVERAEVASGQIAAGPGNPGVACTDSSQCAEPFVCRNGVCASECVGARDCPAGTTCVDRRCTSPTATSCHVASECPGTLVCIQRLCVDECHGDKDCPFFCAAPGGCKRLSCDPASKRCGLDGADAGSGADAGGGDAGAPEEAGSDAGSQDAGPDAGDADDAGAADAGPDAGDAEDAGGAGDAADAGDATDASGGTVASPTILPPPGRYGDPQTITISTVTPNASIRYTTDGTIPTESTGTLYVGSFSLATSATVRAIAYRAGWTSQSASATYAVNTGWTRAYTPVANGSLEGAAIYGRPGGAVVFVGSGGEMISSVDGTTLIARTSGTSATLRATAYGENTNASMTLAVGDNVAVRATSEFGPWTSMALPGPMTLRAVEFMPTNGFVAWAVGSPLSGQSGILKFEGVGFEHQTSGPAVDLYGVSVVDRTHAWVVGAQGTIARTTDGLTWATLTSGTTERLNAVAMVGATTGWAVGENGTILRTSDGVSWAPQVSGTTASLSAVAFYDASLGWVAGTDALSSFILKTLDGGTTWTLDYRLPFSQAKVGLAVKRTAQPSLFASGDGSIVRWSPDDPAPHWTVLHSRATLRGVDFSSANTAWAVGDYGVIAKTTDTGSTWTFPPRVTSERLNKIQWVNPNVGFVAGANGTVLRTTDGGTTWTAGVTGVTANLQSLSFTTATDGWVCGEGALLKTTDGGATFSAVTTAADSTRYVAVSFVSPTVGYALVYHSLPSGGNDVFKTTDGGASWSQRVAVYNGTVYDMKFADANNGWYALLGGVLQRTVNGGATWLDTSGSFSNGTRLRVLNATRVWGIREGMSTAARTRDGVVWEAIPTPGGGAMNDLAIFDVNVGLAVGDRFYVARGL